MRKLIPNALIAYALTMSLAVAQSPGQSTQPAQAQAIRYMDLTKRADGWDFGQGLAINGSSNRRIVIVSYLDEATTASFLRIAESYRGGTTNLPIFGVLRSPLPPASVSRTPNPLGFDIFFDGTAIPPMERPDPRFTRTDQLSAFMRGIHRNYFAATAEGGCFDIKLEPDPKTGGLRIPEQRVCPPFKPASP